MKRLLLPLTLLALLVFAGCCGHHQMRQHGNCGQPCQMQAGNCEKCAQKCQTPCPNCTCKGAATGQEQAPAK